jgi:hypothetical protein
VRSGTAMAMATSGQVIATLNHTRAHSGKPS